MISAVFIEIFQHNQQHDTLLPLTPCVHKLKAGIAYVERAGSMARSMTSPIHIIGLVHAM